MSLSRREFLKMAGSSAAGMAMLSRLGQMGLVSAQDVTNITFGGWGAVAEDEGVKAAIQVFMEEHPEIAVEWQHTPEAGVYAQNLLTNFAAGTAPDTSFIVADQYDTLAVSGALMDITDLIKEDPLLGQPGYFLEPQESDRCAINGRWYGIGSTWVAHHIYYNAQIFEDAGITPPGFLDDEIWEWDDFLEICNELTMDGAGRHPNDSGFDPDDIQQYAIDWPMGWWMPLVAAVFSNDGGFFNEDGLLVLDSPEAMEAIQRVADLIYVHNVAPRSASMESLGMNNTQMINTGRLAMGVDGSWALSWINPSMMDVPIGTGALPKMVKPATCLQAHFHSILSTTQHPEEAWQWVRFLATPFYQEHFAKIGLWTPNQTAMLTEEGLKGWITEGIHPDNYAQWAADYLPAHGVAVSLLPGFIEANANFIQPAVDAVANGEKAVDVFPEAVRQANEVLISMKESM